MHAPLKLNSQFYLIETYHWNRIIVEISAKYIDLIYMLYICQKSDKRFSPWKIVVIYFLLRLWLYVGLCPSWACFTDIRTSPLVIERCLCSTAKCRVSYLSLLLQQCAFDITPEVERREVNKPQWRCNPAGIRKHSLPRVKRSKYLCHHRYWLEW